MNREDMFELLQDLDGRYITEVDRKKNMAGLSGYRLRQ